MPLGKSAADGTRELITALTRWAEATPWVAWLELSGSFGRGAGDEQSDVDAGIGVSEQAQLDDVETAVQAFAPTAASVREPFGAAATHLVTVYRDGRQLSLTVMPEAARNGIPPEAISLVDKNGRLREELGRSRWDPDEAEKRRWTFAACVALSDALKHSVRGSRWRALRSLNEARDLYLQLLAAQEGVIFPQFGAVSLENADRPIPSTLVQTLPSAVEPGSIHSAVQAMLTHLRPFIEAHDLQELIRAIGLSAR